MGDAFFERSCGDEEESESDDDDDQMKIESIPTQVTAEACLSVRRAEGREGDLRLVG